MNITKAIKKPDHYILDMFDCQSYIFCFYRQSFTLIWPYSFNFFLCYKCMKVYCDMYLKYK